MKYIYMTLALIYLFCAEMKAQEADSITVGSTVTRSKSNFVVGAYYDFGIGTPYRISGSHYHRYSSSSNGEYGINIGYQMRARHGLKIGFFSGAGYATNDINLTYSNIDYCFLSNADVDGDTYFRHYSDLKIKESVRTTDILVPIYADFEYDLYKGLGLYVDLGVKLHVCMKRERTKLEGSADVYGVFQDYGNVVLDQNWGYDGFGHVDFVDATADDIEKVGIIPDLMCGIGMRYNIPHTPLAVDAGLRYVNSSTNAFNVYNMSDPHRNMELDATNSIVFNEIRGTESKEHVRSIIRDLKSIRHDALSLHVTVMCKF